MRSLRHVLLTPSYHRARLVRWCIAGLCLVIAAISALSPLRTSDPTAVILSRDVAAGAEISAADLSVVRVPERLRPTEAFGSIDDAAGRVAASALRSGEILHSGRVLGPELTAQLAGDAPAIPEATMVPITVADPAVSGLLQHGDAISILTWADNREEAVTIVPHARVALAQHPADSDVQPGTILVVLPQPEAHTVAAAALHGPLTVVITGARAGGNHITGQGELH
ncbi:SAF domain-containing protein [Corynebacterium ciconiae]|uniref:SAF domain-containing protein n=1 Tax=Corynebacterium ciconiae TaxID=227319 RepID=UPI0026480FA2|nr:SAF domain-containing protein [Corynebacterium ciconiae]